MGKQVNSNNTKLVRIDARWVYHAKLEGVKRGRTVKSLVEEGLELVLGSVDSNTKPQKTSEL